MPPGAWSRADLSLADLSRADLSLADLPPAAWSLADPPPADPPPAARSPSVVPASGGLPAGRSWAAAGLPSGGRRAVGAPAAEPSPGPDAGSGPSGRAVGLTPSPRPPAPPGA
ncbi:hypothetical protein [Streptomyces sp. NPDC050704]|uniref:hypothetical protein n=1 Tax=Streptomyces sp. NPDC050704 TaxID=3157219 RepID=UPI00343A9CCC